jgi:hypothetical protein
MGELALFRREAIEGSRVTGVMRAVIEEDLSVTFIIKTGLVQSSPSWLITATLRYDLDDHYETDFRGLPVPPALATI